MSKSSLRFLYQINKIQDDVIDITQFFNLEDCYKNIINTFSYKEKKHLFNEFSLKYF